MTFFFDNNIGLFIVQGLRAFGEDVTHLTEHFTPNAKDEDWLKFIGQNGMFLVTRDKRIRRRPLELDALRRNKVGAFVLVGKEMDRWSQIEQVVRAWPKIREASAATPLPFAFRVNRFGSRLDKLPLA